MPTKSPRNRRPIIEPLEPRLLFSATADIAVVDDGNSDVAYLINAAANTDLALVYQAQHAPLQATGLADAQEYSAVLDSSITGEALQAPTEIVFIDTSVDQYQVLLDDILQNSGHNNIAVVLLDQHQNGVEQITASLANYSGLAAIHLISHGTSGSVQLGNAVVNQNTLASYDDELIAWRESLHDDADILIYGCDLASNNEGLQLIDQIAALTQADIAASDDLTGQQSRGGDWKLEIQRGEISTNAVISEATQQSWDGVLADVNHIHVDTAIYELAFSSSNNVGQRFIFDSPDATYTVNQLSIQLKKDVGAAEQNITVQLFDAWNGTQLGVDTKSSNSLSSTDFEWKTFDFADVQLNDNQTYYIRISSDLNDGLVMVSHHQSDMYNNGALIENGVPNPNSWDIAFKVTNDDGNNAVPTVVNPIPDQSASEQVAFDYPIPANTFADADIGDNLSYTAQLAGGGNLPPWLTFDAATRTFSGMPDNGNVGTITIEVIATDDYGASVSDNFDLVVSNTNDDPFVANPIANQAATENITFNFTFPANAFGEVDPDDFLSYTAQIAGGGALPAWLSFDSATRTFSGTPTDADVGTFAIEVTATDQHGGAPASDTFDVTVYNSSFVADTIYETSGPSLGTAILSPGQALYQTFTHSSGTGIYTIDYIAVQLRKDPAAQLQDITVSLLQSFNGAVIASNSISSSVVDNTLNWETFNFSNLVLTDGQQYFIKVMASGSDGLISAGIHDTNVYPDGNFVSNSGNHEPGRDLAFQVASGVNNNPQVANPIPNQIAIEDVAYDFIFSANTFSDIDPGDVLTYSAQMSGGGALPAWLSFDAATRTFSGTPTNSHVGTLSVEVTANDGQGGAPVSDTFDIVIQNRNDAPAIANAIPNQTATEDVAFTFQFPINTFNDIDAGDTLTYTAQLAGGGALPAWLDFDAVTRTFSGTPTNAQVGTVSIDVIADDGNGGAVADNFDIVVANVNDAPTLANPIANQNALESTAFNFQFSSDVFNDIDVTDTLTYTATISGGGALPAWLNFDSATRTFSGVPTASDVGSITLDIVANDNSGATVADTFTITVAGLDDTNYVDTGEGPHFNPVSSVNQLGQSFAFDSVGATYTVNEISLYLARYGNALAQTITVELRDAWNGNLLGSDSMASSQISATGFEWHSFNFSNIALNDSQSYVIQISTSANDDSILVSRFDTDVYADGALLENGIAHGSGWDLAFKISKEDGSNSAPTLDNPVSDQTVNAESAFILTVPADTFSDADLNDTISYRAQLAGGGSMGWLTFNEITRTFSGTPHWNQSGTMQVELIATDNHGASTSAFFDIEVINTNNAPSVANTIPDQNATENVAFNFQFSASTFADVDAGHTFTYTTQVSGGGGLPAWLSFDAATRTFSGTPANGDVGVVNVDVMANDGFGGTVIDTFSIVIGNTNDAPTLANPIPDQTATQNAGFLYPFPANTFDDIDVGDTLTYSAQLAGGGALPAWLSFDAATRTFAGTPANSDVGTLAVEVIADDQQGGIASALFNIAINNVNDAPRVANPIPDQLASEDIAFNFSFSANTFDDIDTGDSLIYTAQLSGGGALPAWLNFDATTRTFSGVPLNADVGVLSVEVTATDSHGEIATENFAIFVTNNNDTPALLNPIPDQTATEDNAFNFILAVDTFNDVDPGDVLTYTAQLTDGSALPTWLHFDAVNQAFTGTPLDADAGTLAVEVIATDNSGAVASDIFNIIVVGINSAPTTNGIADVSNIENSAGDELDLFAAFADEEDVVDQLIFTVVGNTNTALINNTSINPVTGILQLNYAANAFGSGIITLRATDTEGALIETSFTVNITHINAPPVTSGLQNVAATTATPPAVVNLKDFFTDAEDGTEMTFSVVGNTNPALAELVALDSSNGFLTLNYSPETLGETTITIRATDSEGAWVESSFNVNVQAVIDAPIAENPVEEPVPSPMNPSQPPVEGPIDTPIETPIETPIDTPTETPPANQTPGKNPDENPIAIPGDSVTDDVTIPTTTTPTTTPLPDKNLSTLVNNLGAAPTLLAPAQFNEDIDDIDRNRPEWIDKQKAFHEQARQQANPYSTLATLIAPESGYLDQQELIDFNDQVSRTRAEMAKVLEDEQQQKAMIAGVTISLTTGILIWSLRASSLFLTLFSMLPLWKGIDPLPILDQVNKRKKELEQQRKDKAREDRNAKEVGYLFDHVDRKS